MLFQSGAAKPLAQLTKLHVPARRTCLVPKYMESGNPFREKNVKYSNLIKIIFSIILLCHNITIT